MLLLLHPVINNTPLLECVGILGNTLISCELKTVLCKYVFNLFLYWASGSSMGTQKFTILDFPTLKEKGWLHYVGRIIYFQERRFSFSFETQCGPFCFFWALHGALFLFYCLCSKWKEKTVSDILLLCLRLAWIDGLRFLGRALWTWRWTTPKVWALQLLRVPTFLY